MLDLAGGEGFIDDRVRHRLNQVAAVDVVEGGVGDVDVDDAEVRRSSPAL
jgi:hypothetical protein